MLSISNDGRLVRELLLTPLQSLHQLLREEMHSTSMVTFKDQIFNSRKGAQSAPYGPFQLNVLHCYSRTRGLCHLTLKLSINNSLCVSV